MLGVEVFPAVLCDMLGIVVFYKAASSHSADYQNSIIRKTWQNDLPLFLPILLYRPPESEIKGCCGPLHKGTNFTEMKNSLSLEVHLVS